MLAGSGRCYHDAGYDYDWKKVDGGTLKFWTWPSRARDRAEVEEPSGQRAVPILVLDAWEHAFYLQYQNRKKEFFEAVWNVWNWEDVAHRFDAVRQMDVALAGATT